MTNSITTICLYRSLIINSLLNRPRDWAWSCQSSLRPWAWTSNTGTKGD